MHLRIHVHGRTAHLLGLHRYAISQDSVACRSDSVHEKENNQERWSDIKYLNFLFAGTKRCGECKNPLTEQKDGIDGALCDICTEAVAPWMNEVVDPYLLALWSIGGHVGLHDDYSF